MDFGNIFSLFESMSDYFYLLFFISWKGSSYVAAPDASRTPVSISSNSDILIMFFDNSHNFV